MSKILSLEKIPALRLNYNILGTDALAWEGSISPHNISTQEVGLKFSATARKTDEAG